MENICEALSYFFKWAKHDLFLFIFVLFTWQIWHKLGRQDGRRRRIHWAMAGPHREKTSVTSLNEHLYSCWCFFKWANPSLFFVYFRPFLITISTTQIEKNIGGVLGIRTQRPQDGRRRLNHGAILFFVDTSEGEMSVAQSPDCSSH